MDDIHQIKRRMELTGHICTQYAYFDHLISNIIWHLLSIEKDLGIIVTGNMEIRPKIEMAIEISDYKNEFPYLRKALQSLKNSGNKSSGFISKRNVIVHGIFFTRDNDPKVMVEAHRKKSLRKRQELTIEYYTSTLQEISDANNKLVALMESLNINVH